MGPVMGTRTGIRNGTRTWTRTGTRTGTLMDDPAWTRRAPFVWTHKAPLRSIKDRLFGGALKSKPRILKVWVCT
jgi:hypothetical protein